MKWAISKLKNHHVNEYLHDDSRCCQKIRQVL